MECNGIREDLPLVTPDCVALHPGYGCWGIILATVFIFESIEVPERQQ